MRKLFAVSLLAYAPALLAQAVLPPTPPAQVIPDVAPPSHVLPLLDPSPPLPLLRAPLTFDHQIVGPTPHAPLSFDSAPVTAPLPHSPLTFDYPPLLPPLHSPMPLAPQQQVRPIPPDEQDLARRLQELAAQGQQQSAEYLQLLERLRAGLPGDLTTARELALRAQLDQEIRQAPRADVSVRELNARLLEQELRGLAVGQISGIRADELRGLVSDQVAGLQAQELRGLVSGQLAGLQDQELRYARASEYGLDIGGDFLYSFGSAGFSTTARAPWAPQDPADSLYRLARNNLNRGDYRIAAATFQQIPTLYPSSTYAADSYYYRALALYRVGSQADLRNALQSLQTLNERYSNSRTSRNDAAALRTRILGTLAAQGDANARTMLAQAAQEGQTTCDREEMAVKTEALSALSRMSPDSTAPILQSVLTRRDECSTSLRRNAMLMLSKLPPEEQVTPLIDVLRNDPQMTLRRDAATQLGRTRTPRALTALESVVNNPADSALHSYALRAVMMHTPERGRQMYRTIIENNSASERLRSDAISALASDTSAAANTYLRSAYTRLESRSLKSRVLSSLGRRPNAETASFLMGLARNTSEPMEMRKAALSTATSTTVPIQDVNSLFDAVTELDLRVQIVSILGVRKEPEATDKLLAIVRNNGNVPEIRSRAIAALTRKNDPRTKALLLEIIGK